MPIDPQIKAMFQDVVIRPTREVPIEEMREIVRGAAKMLPPSTARLKSIQDSTVPGPAGDIPVRVYTPEGQAPFPVVLFFHSGGWVIGDLDSEDGIARSLADKANAIVVSVDYRLAPEHPFPAPNDDAYAATKWVALHAAELNGDPTRIAVAGTSAGGVLAVATALRARDEGDPPLVGWVNVYGSCDYPSIETGSHREWADGIVLLADDVDYYYDIYIGGDVALRDHPYVSPARTNDLSDLVPGLICTAECDPSRDHAEAFGRRLLEAGIDATTKRYPGMIHGFLNWSEFLPGGAEAMTDIGEWLKRRFADA